MREFPKVTMNTVQTDSIETLDAVVDEYLMGIRPAPCEAKIDELSASCRHLKKLVLDEFHQENYGTFDEIAKRILCGVNNEIFENFIQTSETLYRINKVENKIMDLMRACRWI